eukprot:7377778-Prymnesium_polylepis.2
MRGCPLQPRVAARARAPAPPEALPMRHARAAVAEQHEGTARAHHTSARPERQPLCDGPTLGPPQMDGRSRRHTKSKARVGARDTVACVRRIWDAEAADIFCLCRVSACLLVNSLAYLARERYVPTV